MSSYSIQDRIFLLQSYYQGQNNVAVSLRKWSSAFKNRARPSHNTVKNLVEKFERTGSVKNDIDARKNKERTVTTPELIEELDKLTTDEPSISMRRAAQRFNISHSTVHKVLRKDLKKFPYKIQTAQRLTEAAKQRRFEFAIEFLDKIEDGTVDLNKIIFTDEAHFWLDGYVNKQNFRIWGTEKPTFVATTPLHPKRVTVWCAVAATGIVGPIFIHENVDADVYEGLLNDYFMPQAAELGWLDGKHWFQQDGAPAHCTFENLSILRDVFESRVISRKYPDNFDEGFFWPGYSPDFSVLDFFFWGYIKDKVYKNAPRTLEELQTAIETRVKEVPVDMLQRAIAAFENRLRMAILTEGSHVENVIH